MITCYTMAQAGVGDVVVVDWNKNDEQYKYSDCDYYLQTGAEYAASVAADQVVIDVSAWLLPAVLVVIFALGWLVGQQR